MIIPVRCMTCGKVIGDLYSEYLRRTKDYTDEHGEINTIDMNSKNVKKTKKGLVMDELGLKRLCCKRHILTHVDLNI
jgi:DNA-directed RNA polymerases I, II, and III subunit RPABC5